MDSEIPKKKKPRDKVKHAALKREYNLKSRYDLLDYDYLDKLTDKELDFLNKFTKEFVGASFIKKSDGTYDDKKNLHKGQELKKDCYDRNNARNRCIFTREKAMGMLEEIDAREEDGPKGDDPTEAVAEKEDFFKDEDEGSKTP